MNQTALDKLTTRLQTLETQLGEVKDLLKTIQASDAGAAKESLLDEIRTLLEDVPKDKLQSLLDYVKFLESLGGSGTGGGEKDVSPVPGLADPKKATE